MQDTNTQDNAVNGKIAQAAALIEELNALGVVPIAVPTVTVLGIHPEDPFKVAVIKHQPGKHRGRRTLVGGKYKLRSAVTPLQQAHIEWAEEAGGEGATLENPELWAIKLDHNADVREVTLSKATDGDCPAWLSKVRARAFFGTPDRIYIATVQGNPAPVVGDGEDLAESVKCEWFDVRTLMLTLEEADSQFGAQHDLILKVYYFVLTGKWQLKPGDFEDFEALRVRLLELQGEEFLQNFREFEGSDFLLDEPETA